MFTATTESDQNAFLDSVMAKAKQKHEDLIVNLNLLSSSRLLIDSLAKIETTIEEIYNLHTSNNLLLPSEILHLEEALSHLSMGLSSLLEFLCRNQQIKSNTSYVPHSIVSTPC